MQAQQARQAVAPAAAVAAVPGEVRVPYIPQVVRDQIRDEVKAEVMTQAKAENWAQPNAFPDWASRISFDGDVRLRYESRSFGNGNSNQITDFAELNDDGPYDVNPNTSSGLPPLLNTREDRDSLLRLRARFGLKAALSESWSAGIRIGTGSDNNPVSTTQTLGGGFGKKDLWLDQGYLTWKPSERLSLTGGRIANPFLSTDLLYSNDLNFDGVAAIFNQPLSRDVALFGTVGAFPVEYSSDTASSNGFDKEDSDNKWMYGAQLGATWKINPQHSLTGALAYYRFDDIEGRRSSPCRPWAGDPECDTDGSRPTFMQKGNTVFLLRDIVPNPADPANTPNPQYVGLASEFNLLDLNLGWDAELPNDFKLRVAGNYVHNLGYDEGDMRKRAGGVAQIANNLGSDGDIKSGANAGCSSSPWATPWTCATPATGRSSPPTSTSSRMPCRTVSTIPPSTLAGPTPRATSSAPAMASTSASTVPRAGSAPTRSTAHRSPSTSCNSRSTRASERSSRQTMKRQTMNTRPFSLPIWAQALLAGAAFAAYASQAAYADSLEERLRAQLRSTTQQLQALQTEQAQATAAKAALESQRDAALAQVKQLSAELARAKGQAEQLSAQQQGLHDRARQMVEASNEQLASTSRPTTSCWSWREPRRPSGRSSTWRSASTTSSCSSAPRRIGRCMAWPRRFSAPTRTSASPR